MKALFYASLDKIYCQSWTKLDESDALWRIYSHNNSAIRIAIKKTSASKLKQVTVQPVCYTDHPFIFLKQPHTLHSLICTKRTIFSHEKEIRLINDTDHLTEEENSRRLECVQQWMKDALVGANLNSNEHALKTILNVTKRHNARLNDIAQKNAKIISILEKE